MKISTRFILLSLLSFGPLMLAAKGPGGGPGSGGGGGPLGQGQSGGRMGADAARQVQSQAGLATLDQFLSLSDDALEQLEATIRRIRQMTPKERQAYRDQIAAYRDLPTEERIQIQSAWGQLDSTVRAAWRDYMMGLGPEERDQVREQLHATPAESRTTWRMEILRKAGMLPEDAPVVED